MNSKLPDVGTTIFAVMSKMAHDHGAINLSQGFPDFDVSKQLIDHIHQAMLAGKNQYAPMPGLPELRRSIASMIFTGYKYSADPETHITVTAGATEAIYSTITALISQNDEVIMFDPAYDCYDPVVRLAGGKPVHIPLTQPDFGIDWELVKARITPHTRMIMLNSPHNPSGAVIGSADLEALEKIVAEHNLLVLSDEVYEHIVFDDLPHESILRNELLRQHGVAVYSFGKTFHATGWKAGYLVAPENLMTEIRKVHQYVTYSVNTPVQWGFAQYASDPQHYQSLGKFYQQKRDLFLDKIKDSAFKSVACHGTYFQLLSYKGISDISDMEMAETLTQKHGIASIPISVFYSDRRDDKILRFCFAKNEETLCKAAEILCKI